MSNYVLKYSRDERVKYISHLDFVRMFHRTVRRSGIPFAFSQGFNPHPIMTVAMPLSVGITADGEYMKVGFEKELTDEDIKALNASFPPGFMIKAQKKYENGNPDISKLDRAIYNVEAEILSCGEGNTEKILEMNELIVMKKTKSGVKPSDIRPYIYSFCETGRKDGVLSLTMCLACGNLYNLKPETVLDAVSEYIDGYSFGCLSIHRKCLMSEQGELF